jgi:hypothetical protein
MAKKNAVLAIVCLTWAVVPPAARADLVQTQTWSGDSSAGNPISFAAEMQISGNALTITLSNNSTATFVPNDVLSSFYFDVFGTNSSGDIVRATLAYTDARGDVYQNGGLQTANASLLGYWDFRGDLDPTLSPFCGFGVGAVGNNSPPYLIPSVNTFSGPLIDGIDYAIYAGDITGANKKITDSLLVQGEASFTFDISGVSNPFFGDNVVFGTGTAPDSLHYTPLPAAVLLGTLGLGAAGLKLRKFV